MTSRRRGPNGEEDEWEDVDSDSDDEDEGAEDGDEDADGAEKDAGGDATMGGAAGGTRSRPRRSRAAATAAAAAAAAASPASDAAPATTDSSSSSSSGTAADTGQTSGKRKAEDDVDGGGGGGGGQEYKVLKIERADGTVVAPFGDEGSDRGVGRSSGTTATVALLKGNSIVVANAGDTRCVLCRDGQTVPLSFDHKPEDDGEQLRIENAGGMVSAEGRIDKGDGGGLNLSRALGDHQYKQNAGLPATEQMVRARVNPAGIYSTLEATRRPMMGSAPPLPPHNKRGAKQPPHITTTTTTTTATTTTTSALSIRLHCYSAVQFMLT